MNFPDIPRLYDTTNATWPALSVRRHEGWDIRNGAGGGKRASAATLAQESIADIAVAELRCWL